MNANEKQSHFTQDSNVFISVFDFMEQQTQIFHEKKRCTVGDLTSSLLHVTHATFSFFIDKSIMETIVSHSQVTCRRRLHSQMKQENGKITQNFSHFIHKKKQRFGPCWLTLALKTLSTFCFVWTLPWINNTRVMFVHLRDHHRASSPRCKVSQLATQAKLTVSDAGGSVMAQFKGGPNGGPKRGAPGDAGRGVARPNRGNSVGAVLVYPGSGSRVGELRWTR